MVEHEGNFRTRQRTHHPTVLRPVYLSHCSLVELRRWLMTLAKVNSTVGEWIYGRLPY